MIQEASVMERPIHEPEPSERECAQAQTAPLPSRDSAEQLNEEMAVIAEIGRVIGSSLNIDEVYESFAAETRKLIAFDSLAVNAYDTQKNTLSVAYVSGLDIGGRRQGDPLVLAGSLSEAVIRTRRSHCIQPESVDEAIGRYPKLAAIFRAGIRSIICLPLICRNEVIGVLHFRSKKPRAYSEQDLRLAEKIVAQIVGAIANARLYSKIREAEKALRESEERYRSLIENASDIVFRTDHAGRFSFVNPAGFRITGYDEADIIGKPYLAFIRSDMRDDAMEHFGRQLSAERQNTYSEYPILTKTGHELWLGQNTQLIVENGRITGFQAVARDITDRKQAEAELKKREALLNEMGRLAKVGAWELDVASKKLIWTKEVYDIHEVDESYEPAVSKSIEFYAPASRPAIEKAVQQALEQGKPFDLELELITAKGNHRWIHATGKADRERGRTKMISGIFQDITERMQSEARIRQLAYHDSLTGLPNRKLFSDRLGMALTQARRNQKSVGIAMLDLDRFKEVNDTLGHDTGDLLLKATAERLGSVLRKGDTVARIGGDEFVLILPELEAVEDATLVAQKIVDRFRKPFVINAHQLIVTASIGIVLYPTDGMDEGTLLKHADIAMYRAKEAGRAGYRLYRKE